MAPAVVPMIGTMEPMPAPASAPPPAPAATLPTWNAVLPWISSLVWSTFVWNARAPSPRAANSLLSLRTRSTSRANCSGVFCAANTSLSSVSRPINQSAFCRLKLCPS